jgi:hypothetical protein
MTYIKIVTPVPRLDLIGMAVITIDILYTLDSAANYSAIQKLKP